MFLCLHLQTSWFNDLEINFKNRLMIYFIFWYIYQLVDKFMSKIYFWHEMFFCNIVFLVRRFYIYVYIYKLKTRSRSYITRIARVILEGLRQGYCAVLLVEVHVADISRTRIIFHYIVLILFRNFPKQKQSQGEVL